MLSRPSSSCRVGPRLAVSKPWAASRLTGAPVTRRPATAATGRCVASLNATSIGSTGANTRKKALRWATGLATVGTLGFGLTLYCKDHIEARLLCRKFEKFVGDPQQAREHVNEGALYMNTLSTEEKATLERRAFAFHRLAEELKQSNEDNQAEVVDYLKNIMILFMLMGVGTSTYIARAPAIAVSLRQRFDTTITMMGLRSLEDEEIIILAEKAEKEYHQAQRKACRGIWNALHEEIQPATESHLPDNGQIMGAVIAHQATVSDPDDFFVDVYKRIVLIMEAKIKALEAQAGSEAPPDVLG